MPWRESARRVVAQCAPQANVVERKNLTKEGPHILNWSHGGHARMAAEYALAHGEASHRQIAATRPRWSSKEAWSGHARTTCRACRLQSAMRRTEPFRERLARCKDKSFAWNKCYSSSRPDGRLEQRENAPGTRHERDSFCARP